MKREKSAQLRQEKGGVRPSHSTRKNTTKSNSRAENQADKKEGK